MVQIPYWYFTVLTWFALFHCALWLAIIVIYLRSWNVGGLWFWRVGDIGGSIYRSRRRGVRQHV